MMRSTEGDGVALSTEVVKKSDRTARMSRPNKTNDLPFTMEEIIDALLFVDSDLSSEKIFCLFTLAKQNFINRINKKPSTFSLTSLEEYTNSNETQRHLDYGRISFMNVRPQGSNNSQVYPQTTRRKVSQSSQRSSISIEDPDAPFSDKLEYLVDYILEVLLVIYPEKLRMVLELEQCLPMYMKLLSTPRNLSFMETIIGNRLSFRSLGSIPERGYGFGSQSKQKCRKNTASTTAKIEKPVRGSLNVTDYSFFKKSANRLIHDASEIPSYPTAIGVPNSPLHYIKNVLESNPVTFKAKLKVILVDFVTNNVQTQARFYRTPSGRGFQREPTSHSGLLRTVLLKVDNQPQDRSNPTKINYSKISESSNRRFFEMNTDTITKKGQSIEVYENQVDIGQMRKRSKNIFQEVKTDRDIKHRLDRSPSIVNPIR